MIAYYICFPRIFYCNLLEEIVDLNKLLATFSKQVVERIILLLFLGEISGSRKTNNILL
jgi:hypothetical protein